MDNAGNKKTEVSKEVKEILNILYCEGCPEYPCEISVGRACAVIKIKSAEVKLDAYYKKKYGQKGE